MAHLIQINNPLRGSFDKEAICLSESFPGSAAFSELLVSRLLVDLTSIRLFAIIGLENSLFTVPESVWAKEDEVEGDEDRIWDEDRDSNDDFRFWESLESIELEGEGHTSGDKGEGAKASESRRCGDSSDAAMWGTRKAFRFGLASVVER